MLKLLFFFIVEFLVLVVIRQHYKGVSRTKFYISITVNALLSIYFWILYNELRFSVLEPDNPLKVLLKMSFTGAVAAILVPRIILIALHFLPRLFKGPRLSPPRVFTNIGFIAWILIFFAIVIGSTTGRYSFRVSRLELPVAGLHNDLDGLRIVQISDLHLAGFHKQPEKLSHAIRTVMNEKPDILVNSGDFVTIGQGEFGRFDTILSRAKGAIASVAVLGNHDIGTYHPSFNIEFRESNIAGMEEHIARSGYLLLNDTSITVQKGEARLALAGVVTMGRHPGIIHGDIVKALNGTDSADFTILVSHDPNHWKEKIAGKTDVGLTLSGHTHGMQMGIITKRFRWSPSKHFYPNWGGLYTEGKQYLYVNTGLGVLGIPFRLGIRPEITVIELKKAI